MPLRKTVETLLRQKNLTHAQRNEILKWETVLDELDHEEELNERRHSEKRDLLDLGLMECENSEEYIATKILLRICRSDTGWLEWIFSKKASDLHQLAGAAKASPMPCKASRGGRSKSYFCSMSTAFLRKKPPPCWAAAQGTSANIRNAR